MDQTDAKILEILQQDGRISMQKLAASISMSAPATAERVRKLEESGAILGYRAVVDPEKIGREVSAIVLVAVPLENRQKFLDYVANSDNIIECMEITGRFGYCLKASCKDAEAFRQMTLTLYPLCMTETCVVVSRPSCKLPIKPILS